MAENDVGEIRLKGIHKLNRKLITKPAETEKKLAKASRAVGFLVQREARRNAPFLEGFLERSIQFEVTDEGVRVYVPVNTPAGKYAKRMHDEEYTPGEGTKSKGNRAGRKYITRAVEGNRAKIHSLFKQSLG